MKFFIALIALFITSYSVFAQSKSNLKRECFSSNVSKTNEVKEFKEMLSLTVEVKKLTIGTSIHDVNFLHKEKIKDESSLIQINDTVAVKVSVARVIDYKNKKYLYKLDLFEKKDMCWRPKNSINYYNEFSIGTISSGYGSGISGSIDYLNIEGTIIIE